MCPIKGEDSGDVVKRRNGFFKKSYFHSSPSMAS